MDTYNKTANNAAKITTEIFSSSFGLATRLFDKSIRQDIYNIYGLARVADEIVDTYQGGDAAEQLDDLEADVYRACKNGFSANVIVHAFAQTARQYGIKKDLIRPFFKSMAMDLPAHVYKPTEYKAYIYGSAEVIGLMCLMVFVGGDMREYQRLQKGASALGAAFQKINFLRDLKDDYETRGRYYFPVGSYETFDEKTRAKLVKDINKDMQVAEQYIQKLPIAARDSVRLAYEYYRRVFKKLSTVPPEVIKERRVRINDAAKILLLIRLKLKLL